MITQDEAIQMALEVGAHVYADEYGKSADFNHEELTALCNAVCRKTLLEAADTLDNTRWFDLDNAGIAAEKLRMMAEGE